MDKSSEHVLVAVAVSEIQAMVYRKILGEAGIPCTLLDLHDNPLVHDLDPKKRPTNIKVITPARDARAAKDIIKNHESARITRTISKSGEHLFFRCPHCRKYLGFPSSQKGTSQICPQCMKIIELPE